VADSGLIALRAVRIDAQPGVLRRLSIVLAWGAAITAFVATPWLPSLCPTRFFFHVPCPSCGLTRAARCILHFDLAGATHVHPLWWLVLPYVGGLAAAEAWSYVWAGRPGRLATHKIVQHLGTAIVVALVAVWAARQMGALGGPVAIQ